MSIRTRNAGASHDGKHECHSLKKTWVTRARRQVRVTARKPAKRPHYLEPNRNHTDKLKK